ncbi:alpha/beta hydrolase [Streptomyces sp. NPDC023838]|uniref:alpha/beta fold hydrolase n=1 Tax=Streptomyces sp. NPDC023838 TaxID=3154325 RepID=UPI0033C4C938
MSAFPGLQREPHPFADADIDNHHFDHDGMSYGCRVVTPRRPAGEPLLVIAGGMQDMYSWARLERRLGSQHQILIHEIPDVDPAPDKAYNWEALSSAVVRTLDTLGIPTCCVLGPSAGYPVAYRLAQKHPQRVSRLILMGASAHPVTAVTDVVREGQRRLALHGPAAPRSPDDADHARDVERVVSVLVNADAARTITPVRAAARVLFNRLYTAPWDPLVHYASARGHLLFEGMLPPGGLSGVPTLVCTGEYDTTTTPEQNREIAATIEGAVFLLMKNADHLLHMERDAEFADLVSRFLTGASLLDLPYCLSPEASIATGN